MTELDQLLARAVLYRWAARLFFSPDAVMFRSLAAGDVGAALDEAAAALPAATALTVACSDLQRACLDLDGSDLGVAEEHTYLFARSVHCPPYETGYDNERVYVRVHDLSEIAGFYAAFGVQVSQEQRELPDHVSMELEFVSYLCAKEAYAREQGWRRKASLCRAARARFLQEHIGRWFPAFRERLGQHARLPFYPAAAAFTQALLDTEPALKGAHHAEPVPSHT